jgi:hypothetical protein
LDDVHVFSSQMADDGWVRGEGRGEEKNPFYFRSINKQQTGFKSGSLAICNFGKRGVLAKPPFSRSYV